MYSYPPYTPHVGFDVITPPSEEAVTLAQMKMHLQEVRSDQDTLIQSINAAARQWIEERIGRTLMDTTYELSFEEYPQAWSRIELRKPPIIEIDTFSYTDSNGNVQEIADDQFVLAGGLAPFISPAYGIAWPATRSQVGSLKVRYRAGYAQAGSPDQRHLIPQPLIAAIKLLAAHLFENREAVVAGTTITEVPFTVEALCKPYRTRIGL